MTPSVSSAVAAVVPWTFARTLVAVDDTAEAAEAARQAALLAGPGGRLHVVGVVDVRRSGRAAIDPDAVHAQMATGARLALERAAADTRAAEQTLLEGHPAELILEHARATSATVLALGGHDERGAPGGAAGTTAGFPTGTVLLREAPCSVLVARRRRGAPERPTRIVAGVDGSPESVRAVAVAGALSEHLGAELSLIVGTGGKLRDAAAVGERYPDVVVDGRAPVEALVAASRSADLVVVGSRGLHGLQALGSVSERVAHRACNSVLVVRGPGVDAAT